MRYNPNIHHRRSIRMRRHNYSQTGRYFVTLCTQNRKHLFGKIMENKMVLNNVGRIAFETWKWLQTQYDHVELDEWAIMPNHLHGIIVIINNNTNGSQTTHINPREGSQSVSAGKRKPIGRIIGAFKTVTTKRTNQIQGRTGIKLWQRNYYEHIIRNNHDLSRIRNYIINNPRKWNVDRQFRNDTP